MHCHISNEPNRPIPAKLFLWKQANMHTHLRHGIGDVEVVDEVVNDAHTNVKGVARLIDSIRACPNAKL